MEKMRAGRPSRIPLPVGKLFTECDFLEFADGRAGNGVEKDEGVGELPFGEGFSEEGTQLLRRRARAIFQDNRGKRTLLPLRVRDADDARFFDGRMRSEERRVGKGW